MTTYSATNARQNIYQLLNQVNEDNSPISITRTNGKGAVLVSEQLWDEVQNLLELHQAQLSPEDELRAIFEAADRDKAASGLPEMSTEEIVMFCEKARLERAEAAMVSYA